MAKLADAADLKSAGPKGLWGFDSPSRHHPSERTPLGLDKLTADSFAIGIETPATSFRYHLEVISPYDGAGFAIPHHPKNKKGGSCGWAALPP